jgi:phosphatidylserine/phosphatidylglycerophosphate/cardiolipin synthase-like enzyme
VKPLAVPIAIFSVDCEIASGQPFGLVERTVLRSIDAGHDEFEALLRDLPLHPRMLTECLSELFEAGILEFSGAAGAFSITSVGREAIRDPDFVPSTLTSDVRSYTIAVERLSGLAELQRNVTYATADNFRGRGIELLSPGDVSIAPARSVIRQLVETATPGTWVRSVAEPSPLFQYSYYVQIDVQDGRIEGLRSARWTRGLTQSLRDRGFELSEPPVVEPERWMIASPDQIRSLSGSGAHHDALDQALEVAQSYVFVHSAFLNGQRVRELMPAISAALRRGVDVMLARGGTVEKSEADEQGIDALKKIAYDERAALGRFYFEVRPTGSHAKVLIRDGREVCIGSFNWLSAPRQSARAELSVCISSSEIVAAACDVAADLFRPGSVLWPAQVLRARVGGEIPASEGVKTRLVLDADNRQAVFRYLDQADEYLTIASGRVTSKDDPWLRERLAATAKRLGGRGGLSLSCGEIEGPGSLLDGLADLGAAIGTDRSTHIKAMLSDDQRALITSFNLLSFSGHSSRRSSGFEIGVELRCDNRTPQIFQHLFPSLYEKHSENTSSTG